MDERRSPDILRELGKEYFFNHYDDEELRGRGIELLLEAFRYNDPEAMFIVAKLVLDSVLLVRNGDPEDYALNLMAKSARAGHLQARAYLNSYCQGRYEKEIEEINKLADEATPLTDFDGKTIKIDRKGVFSPIDAVLEFKDGRNILTLSTNVAFIYLEEGGLSDRERFEAAVLDGILQWSGEYEVFGGQKLTVEVKITQDSRIFDNLVVMPVTSIWHEAFESAEKMIIQKSKREQLNDLRVHKRSFATNGIKWSVNSRKFIFIQSKSGNFDDYEEFMHVAKHEFGHSLGLGDLYQSNVDSLNGVKKGTYRELDGYALSEDNYNLVMCDHHGPVSNNDIEMVVLAFKENREQLFQQRKSKGKISSALGKGN